MRGGPDRRRSPPPRRHEERRYPGPPPPPRDRRRQRTLSPPPDRFRRSPPAAYKRHRREEEPYDRYGRFEPYERRRPYRSDPYDDDPRGGNRGYARDSPPPPRQNAPMSYREFILDQPDSVTPEEAQANYQAYLADWWGSAIRAEFERRKNEESLKRRFEPKEVEKLVGQRNQLAAEAAKKFAVDVEEKILDPSSADFNQGDDGLPPGPWQSRSSANGSGDNDEVEVVFAASVCWAPFRVASDLELSRQLVKKVDKEKGISENKLLADVEATTKEAASNGNASDEDEGAAIAKNDGDVASEKHSDKHSNGPEEVEYEAKLSKLDLLLTYLWRVHGVDYYAGIEYWNPDEDRHLLKRCLRGPKPEDGEQADDAEEKKSLSELKKVVDTRWKSRIEGEDPFEEPLQRARVEKALEEFIESQVVRIDENKWGSRLSQKLFVGKEYVLKHIKVKHPHVVEAEKEKVLAEVFYDNFKRFKEEEDAAKRRAQEKLRREQEAAVMEMMPPPPADDDVDMKSFSEEPMMDEMMDGGFDGMAGPMRRGRGRAGMGNRGMRSPIMDGPMMAPMMAAPLPGQMLIPAPGAGPLGPFIMAPIPAGGPPPLDIPPPMPPPRGMLRGGRGMPRGRGFGRGPFHGPAFFMAPPGAKLDPCGVREYVDLDAPANNRSVLDYGDL